MSTKAPREVLDQLWKIEAFLAELRNCNPGIHTAFNRNNDGTFHSVLIVVPGAKARHPWLSSMVHI